MELNHTFTVPAPIDEAWEILRDVERVGPCMPGATIESVEDDRFTGRVKVKVGPMTVTYRGSARFSELDEEAHRAVIEASGKEARGSGTAQATVRATLRELSAGETEVAMTTDLAITGKPAQFGRGVMDDVGKKLVGQFADRLSDELSGKAEPEPAATPEAPAGAPAAGVGTAPTTPEGTPSALDEPAPTVLDEAPPVAPDQTAPVAPERSAPAAAGRPTRDAEAIDLLDLAGAPVLKRLAPLAGAVAMIALIVWLFRRPRGESGQSG